MNIGHRQISLKSGDVVPISDGITVLVGANNVGKTRLLSDIAHYSAQSRQEPDLSLIKHAIPRYRGTVDAAVVWLEQNARMVEDGQTRVFTFDLNQDLRESFVRSVWDTDRWAIDIRPLVRMLTVDSRLENVADTDSFSVLGGSFRSQSLSDLQRLWSDPRKLDELNGMLMDAFGETISIPRDLGPTIAMFVGAPSGSVDRDPDDYRRELMSLRRLVGQGHGMRAYASILMSIVTTSARVLLIDEPEAFLHPPQARLLGYVLERVRQ